MLYLPPQTLPGRAIDFPELRSEVKTNVERMFYCPLHFLNGAAKFAIPDYEGVVLAHKHLFKV